MKKVELLAPAGNLEKLKMAILFGADAVYIGGDVFGLRANADNFNTEEMIDGITYAHERDKKVFLTLNIIPHNEDLKILPDYLAEAVKIGIDAVIVSDPGVFSMVKELAPNMEIHISTQANNTNWRSVKFWHEQGAKRVVLARELSLKEIAEIRANVSEELEIESFVHGAMCIAYSGRCSLSSYMIGRNANKGDCAQPCRWNYSLVEEKRPGEYFPVIENERGTYIFNSKDLCMIEHIPEIIKAGVYSLKIEGRMKSSYYVATTVRAYRRVIDEFYKNPINFKFDAKWLEETEKSSHRQYTTGFNLNKPDENSQVYHTNTYVRDYDFVGIVLEYDETTGMTKVEQRNKMSIGDEIEIVPPQGELFIQNISKMTNLNGEIIETAPHPQMIIYLKLDKKFPELSVIRRKLF